MDILRCQHLAKEQGFDNARFKMRIPGQEKHAQCRWIDAYFGLFTFDGLDGFVTVSDMDSRFPGLECFDFEVQEEAP